MHPGFCPRLSTVFALLLFLLTTAPAATEYFVALDGCDDTHAGRSRDHAFASIQRGVDALDPGDTLTILPGEYFGTIRGDDLGAPDADTTIRAETPGTVVLRGDIAAPAFWKMDGFRYVYVTAFDTEVHVVNELDTLRVLEAAPNIDELDFSPGHFHQDLDAGRLYLSSTDLNSVLNHRYSFAVSGTHGIYLRNPVRLTIEGLAVTGFNRHGLLSWQESVTDGATWGIFLRDASHCVVRDCRAYFNGRGMVLSSGAAHAGHNVIEHCTAWANASRFGGSYGGISLHMPRNDRVRDSIVFRNGHKGINIRSDAQGTRTVDADGNEVFDVANLSRIVNNLAWGNPGSDFKIKTGYNYIHTVESCIGLGTWSVRPENVSHSIVGRPAREHSPDTINLATELAFDPEAEFADPFNFDYRLQSTSRFCGAGPEGVDRGPFPYAPNIFYLRTDGDDTADGLSVETAWQTLARASEALKPGDTLYLAAGEYAGTLRLSGVAQNNEYMLNVRGRGRERVVLRDTVVVEESGGIAFERLEFARGIIVRDSASIRFDNALFTGNGTAIEADNVVGLKVTHSAFTGFERVAIALRGCRDAFFSGNLYDTARGSAFRTDDAGAVRYSDYNAYREASAAWEVDGVRWSLAQLSAVGREHHATVRVPDYRVVADAVTLANPIDFAVVGPHATPAGPYLPQVGYADESVTIHGPVLHSATPTTANIEWWSSRPEVFEVHWGETPDLENRETLAPSIPYHPHGTHVDPFNTFSMNGLKPGTQYHFRLVHPDADDTRLRFTTPIVAFPPRDLHVSVEGDNANDGLSLATAWRTVGHAADRARPGDTIRIAAGVYPERVRVRTTGEADAPIVFTSLPGEQVIFDGNQRMLASAFNVFNKRHIVIDGFYFRNHGRIWTRGLINIQRAKDIQITRCFADGRSRGTSPELVTAGAVDNLRIRNCVMNTGWGGIALGSVNGLRFENNVIIRSDITPVGFHAVRNAVIARNIITDNLGKKHFAALVPSGSPTLVLEENVFYLRRPESDRPVFGERHGETLAAHDARTEGSRGNITINPKFNVLTGDTETADKDFFSDAFIARFNDFPDLFTTHPDLIERGIGLQPKAFEPFHSNR